MKTRKFDHAKEAVAWATNRHPMASFEPREGNPGFLIRESGNVVARITLWDAENGVWQYRSEQS